MYSYLLLLLVTGQFYFYSIVSFSLLLLFISSYSSFISISITSKTHIYTRSHQSSVTILVIIKYSLTSLIIDHSAYHLTILSLPSLNTLSRSAAVSCAARGQRHQCRVSVVTAFCLAYQNQASHLIAAGKNSIGAFQFGSGGVRQRWPARPNAAHLLLRSRAKLWHAAYGITFAQSTLHLTTGAKTHVLKR